MRYTARVASSVGATASCYVISSLLISSSSIGRVVGTSAHQQQQHAVFSPNTFQQSRSHRILEEAAAAVEGDDDYQYDLSSFSVRFEKCQYVNMYDDELAEDEDSATPLALKHFVVFRLCPTDDCETCEPYGQYTVDVQDFLELSIENQRKQFENMCGDGCDDEGNEDGDDDDMNNANNGCPQECLEYQNMEANGYVDAADYTECQELDIEQDDDSMPALYVGPRCNSGNYISIGLFYDENCFEPVADDGTYDVEELLGAKLSYLLLQHTFAADGSSSSSNGESTTQCLSCMEENDDNDDRDNADADAVNEMCENLYNSAAKCESETGLPNGFFIQANEEEGNYENQVQNEYLACNFIHSLIWDSYSETGEIVFDQPLDVIVRVVTQNQMIALGGLLLIFSSLLGLLRYYETKIKSATSTPTVLLTDNPLT